MLCRALFHVMARTEEIGHGVLIRAIPTHSKRDGSPAEENRRFWEATPSGELLLKIAAGSALDSPAMQVGAYVFLDLGEPGADGAGVLTEWKMDALTISGDYRQFRAELVPAVERRDAPGANTTAGIASWGSKLTMDVNNIGVLPTFAIEPGVARALSIRFSLSEPRPT
jgi:hypothetical protein